MEASRATLDRVQGRIKLGESLDQAAEAESLTVTSTPEFARSGGVPGLGRDAGIMAAAFDLPLGEISEAIEGNRGWAIIRVDERPEMDWAAYEEQKDSLRQSQLAIKQNRLLGAFLDDLRRNAEIVDYRGRT